VGALLLMKASGTKTSKKVRMGGYRTRLLVVAVMCRAHVVVGGIVR